MPNVPSPDNTTASNPQSLSDNTAVIIGGAVAAIFVTTIAIIRNKCKNISIKMLKDVGMTVPKSRETRAVYMQQHRG